MGLGFRGSSPPWPYVGRGRGGLPRCGYYLGSAASTSPSESIAPEQELAVLNDQAQAIKAQLDEIEARIREIESKGK
jgi:ubiquinone biosynthesis protein UbiJ